MGGKIVSARDAVGGAGKVRGTSHPRSLPSPPSSSLAPQRLLMLVREMGRWLTVEESSQALGWGPSCENGH